MAQKYPQKPKPMSTSKAMTSTAATSVTMEMFEVFCSDCGATLKIDPVTRTIIAHTPAPRKKTFEDFEAATRALREQEERKESLFRQSVDAEKNKGDVLSKKFAEALKKANETPDFGRPLRDFDLD